MRPDFGSADPSRASHDRLRKTDETAVPLRSPNLLCRWLLPRSRLSDELAALGLDSGPRQPPDSQNRTKGDLECGLITLRFRSKVFTMCSAQCLYHVPVLTDTRVDIRSLTSRDQRKRLQGATEGSAFRRGPRTRLVRAVPTLTSTSNEKQCVPSQRAATRGSGYQARPKGVHSVVAHAVESCVLCRHSRRHPTKSSAFRP